MYFFTLNSFQSYVKELKQNSLIRNAMLKLFSKLNPYSGFKKIKIRSFNQFQPRVQTAIETLLTKYRNFDYTVPADHVIIKLIQTYGEIPTDMSDESFIDSLFDITPRLANSLGMTSEINRGKQFKGEFYHRDGTELIFLYSERFDVDHASVHWRNLQPVKVMRHPFLNTGLEVPNNNFSERTDEPVIIGINLAMLLFQYRKFFQFEEVAYFAGAVAKNIYNYVGCFVLPNMLFSHVDIVILNRFFEIYKNGRAANKQVKQPVLLIDWGAALDRELTARAAICKKTSVSMETLLYSTDGMFEGDNAWLFTKLPNVPRTSAINWLLAFSRSKLVNQLRMITNPNLDSANLAQMAFEIDLIRSKHVYNNVLDQNMVTLFEGEMEAATA